MILAALTSALLLTDQKGRAQVGLCLGHPVVSLLGCWKRDMLVPWKESIPVVELGLWSMLSTAAGKNNPFLRLGRHTHLSQLHCSNTQFPRAFDMSINLSYEMDNPSCNNVSTDRRLRVFPYTVSPT